MSHRPDAAAADEGTAPFIAYEEFRNGLPRGRFHVVINPQLARPYVMRRAYVNAFSMAFIGAGAVLALSQQSWTGALLVALGVAANRLMRWQAPRILLHLAQADARTYYEVTQQGLMEVQRR